MLSEADRAALIALEEKLWRPQTRFDPAFMERVLAQDFLEFGRSGRAYSRNDTLNVEATPFQAILPLANLSVRELGPDVVQLIYESEVTFADETQHARRSSIWVRTPDGWKLRFHQGTPLPAAT